MALPPTFSDQDIFEMLGLLEAANRDLADAWKREQALRKEIEELRRQYGAANSNTADGDTGDPGPEYHGEPCAEISPDSF